MHEYYYHIPPPGGWKQNTKYVVEIAMHQHNTVFQAILEIGFLFKKNCILTSNYTYLWYSDQKLNIKDVLYIKAVREIDTSIPNEGKFFDRLNVFELAKHQIKDPYVQTL